MTDLPTLLRDLERLARDATKGPWSVINLHRVTKFGITTPLMSYMVLDEAKQIAVSVGSENENDHKLIAALHNSLPTLLAALRENEQDARRYRWLRDKAEAQFRVAAVIPNADPEQEYEHQWFGKMAAEYLDKHIDQAMSAAPSAVPSVAASREGGE